MIVFLSTDICAQTRDFCSKKVAKDAPPQADARVGRQANLVIVKTLCRRVYFEWRKVFFLGVSVEEIFCDFVFVHAEIAYAG